MSTPFAQVFNVGDGSVRKVSDISGAVASIRAAQAGGVHSILIGLAPSPGWKIDQTKPGIIAILIGLLLPAVQNLCDGSVRKSPEISQLIGLLRPGGTAGFLMCDGSVRKFS